MRWKSLSGPAGVAEGARAGPAPAGAGEELLAAVHLQADVVEPESLGLAGDDDVHALAAGAVLGVAGAGIDDVLTALLHLAAGGVDGTVNVNADQAIAG